MKTLKQILSEQIRPQDVETFYQYHDKLNPNLWADTVLDEAVRNRLLEIANLFIDFLKIPKRAVKDIILTGSSVNYNWTPFSDIDLHVVIDKTKISITPSEFLDDYLQMKRKIFNDRHDIRIRGMEVELYPQDKNEVNVSSGFYSLSKNKWIKFPRMENPSVDDFAVKSKVAAIMNSIDDIMDSGCTDSADADEIREKITNMRRTGLATHGEYSVENLAFKTLRNNGYIEKIMRCSEQAVDKKYSLE